MDMDGSLCEEICWTITDVQNATPRKDVIKKWNDLYYEAITIIATGRHDDLMSETIKWLRDHGVRYWGITNNKPLGDQYVDDLAMTPEEFVSNKNK